MLWVLILTMKGKGDQLQGREEGDGMKRRAVEEGREGWNRGEGGESYETKGRTGMEAKEEGGVEE